MNCNSAIFSSMRKRVEHLENRYLPSESTQLGDYGQDEQDDARACVLLAHAEIEYYLEQASMQLADFAKKQVADENYDEKVMALIFNSRNARDLANPSDLGSANECIDGITGLHAKKVSGNNGLKQRDVKKLFDPFYFGGVSLDGDLGSELDTFGSKRGDYAHRGAVGINKQINCYEVRKVIDNLLDMLALFDSDVVCAGLGSLSLGNSGN